MARREAAMYAPVDCTIRQKRRKNECNHTSKNRKEQSNIITSIMDTNTAAIMATEWPASNVGAPHCKGYGNLNLTNITCSSK